MRLCGVFFKWKSFLLCLCIIIILVYFPVWWMFGSLSWFNNCLINVLLGNEILIISSIDFSIFWVFFFFGCFPRVLSPPQPLRTMFDLFICPLTFSFLELIVLFSLLPYFLVLYFPSIFSSAHVHIETSTRMRAHTHILGSGASISIASVLLTTFPSLPLLSAAPPLQSGEASTGAWTYLIILTFLWLDLLKYLCAKRAYMQIRASGSSGIWPEGSKVTIRLAHPLKKIDS